MMTKTPRAKRAKMDKIATTDPDAIVGHKTMSDGRHLPITRAEADEIVARYRAEDARRAGAMPTVESAIHAMWDAWYRLKQLGWREAIYCPKDGSEFEIIEPGSTGIHRCHYGGDWPKGTWWVHHGDGDCPSHPVLFRPLPEGQPEKD